MKARKNTVLELAKAVQRAKNFKLSEWYSIRSLMGNANWAIFYILLGARESGKSYAVMEYFVRS